VRRASVLIAFAAALAGEDLVGLASVPTRTRLSGEVLVIDDHERMATAGLHEDLFFSEAVPGAYLGLGGYGAMGGNRGGFFVLGASLGWTTPTWHGLGLDLGGFAGGGGGGSDAGQGSGLMLRAQAVLACDIPGGALQLGVARSDFPSGTIDSTSLTAGLVIDDAITLATLGGEDRGSGVLDIQRWGFAPVAMRYRFDDDVRGRHGLALTPTLDLAGVEFTRAWDDHWSTPVQLAGALGGNRAGYMEVFTGLAGNVGKTWNLEARALAGLGGGGDLDTGGGVMLRPELAVGRRLGRHWLLQVRGGRAWALEGDFAAWMGAAALRWDPEQWHLVGDGRAAASIPAEAVGFDPWRLVLGGTAYRFRDGGHGDVQLMDLALEKPVTPWFAVVGRTRSAYAGGVGGYSEGLFGLRGEWAATPWLRLAVEGDLGAGGGGGMPTGRGLIAGVSGDLSCRITRSLDLRVAYGRVEGLDDDLDVDSLGVGLVWRFARALVR
jgi:hypothetical protein